MVHVEEGRYHDHDQDAHFPVPNHSILSIFRRVQVSDPYSRIGDLEPSEDGNQQTGDLSNAMPQENLGRIPA